MTPPNMSLILVMVCFWATLWLVQRFLIRPVGATLEERRQRVEGAQQEWAARNEEYLSAITRVEVKLEGAAKEAGQVRGDLRQQAMDTRQAALESAKERADARLIEAVNTLDSDAETARQELRRRAQELARLLADRLLAREVGS